jgi:hypothetical protein
MGLVISRELRLAGSATGSIESAARRGENVRLRPGAYVSAEFWQSLPDRDRHLLKVQAAARTLSAPLFSHESAAAVRGIPIVGGWPETVCVSFQGSAGRSSRVGIRWHRAAFEEGDVETIDGLCLTSLRRTAIDIARNSSLASGVVALDYAFAEGVARDAACEWMEAQRPFSGVRSFQAAIEIARGKSESPLESVSLTRCVELGFPRPVQQQEFVGADGRRYRSDFYWPDYGIVGEADGRSKYLTPEDLWREKRREDAIRPLVRGFLRWGWAEAWAGEPLAALLSSAGIPRSLRR